MGWRKKADCKSSCENSSVLEQFASIKHCAVETGRAKFILQTVFVSIGRHFRLQKKIELWSKVHIMLFNKYSPAGASAGFMVFHFYKIIFSNKTPDGFLRAASIIWNPHIPRRRCICVSRHVCVRTASHARRN